ncbi:MAG: threonyl-tRNA synthetase editing domain-containing protein [Bacteroidales bacterium]|nr:threonyl-tRNA synthetase editing domain-containing protein [Bacteroidales bacterium]MCF8334028.1 threonyl-tRNA synthetase editing domain-containing protein [Bacteroidales bacterium]
MKLLMIYCERFGYKPQEKNLNDFPDLDEGKVYENVLVGFIHAESQDEYDAKGVETKLIKNLKWAAKKNNTRRVILHSFAHLAESRAEPHFTKRVFDQAQNRLQKANYEAYQTPFGYFLELDVKAPGKSEARIFKSFS